MPFPFFHHLDLSVGFAFPLAQFFIFLYFVDLLLCLGLRNTVGAHVKNEIGNIVKIERNRKFAVILLKKNAFCPSCVRNIY